MILLDKEEKMEVLKYFPKTTFVRTMIKKSKRHRYYMTEEKDQLRFLSGLDKTKKNNQTNEIEIVIPGIKKVNYYAVKAFEKLLSFNIQYYSGTLGGGNQGDLLDEYQVSKSIGLKKHCEFELGQVRKRYKEILKR